MGFWRQYFSRDEIIFILEQIKKHRNVSDQGIISFSNASNWNGWLAILVSAVNFDVRTEALRDRVVRSVIMSSDLTIDFSEEDFRNLAHRILNRYQHQELDVFRVAIPIWNLPQFIYGMKNLGEVKLNFTPSQKTPLFKIISREREVQRNEPHYKSHFTQDRLNDLQRCSLCLAHIRANSAADAYERASEALYEIIGLVNLAADRGKHWRMSFRASGKLPVSDILIGPHTTVHSKSGRLAFDGFWHENWVGGPNRRNLRADAMAAWEKRVQKLEQGIIKSNWRDQCKSAVVRYFKAFSNPNLEESFLEGWRLFENIAGSQSDNVREKILRASNIFENNVEYGIVGRHLGLRRNLLAHGHAIKTDDEETIAFQMLQFVAPFLERYILNGFDFGSPKEFWEFLELPTEIKVRVDRRSELERQIQLLEKVARFRGETH